MQKKWMHTAVIGALMALGTSAANAQVSDGVVKIGVLTDMSGVYSQVGGKGAVEAANMAVADFIAKEKPDFKIEVVSADHQNKADVGAAKAREWFDKDKVDMITELLNSGVAIAVQKLGAEKKKITINTGAASTALTNAECTPYGIHYVYDTYALATGTGAAVVKSGGKSWYFVTADYAFGQALEKDTSSVVTKLGGQILGSVKHPLSTPDFSSFLLQAQASKAQVIALANAGGDFTNAVKQAREFGIVQKGQQIAGMLIFDTDVKSLGLDVAQGLTFTTGFYWDRDDASRAWSKGFMAKTKQAPTMSQAGVYSGVYNYLAAVKATKTDDADKVRAQLGATKINDFFAKGGEIRADGRMVHDMYLAEAKKPSESKGEWDLMKIKATIPGSEAYMPLSASTCKLVKK